METELRVVLVIISICTSLYFLHRLRTRADHSSEDILQPETRDFFHNDPERAFVQALGFPAVTMMVGTKTFMGNSHHAFSILGAMSPEEHEKTLDKYFGIKDLQKETFEGVALNFLEGGRSMKNAPFGELSPKQIQDIRASVALDIGLLAVLINIGRYHHGFTAGAAWAWHLMNGQKAVECFGSWDEYIYHFKQGIKVVTSIDQQHVNEVQFRNNLNFLEKFHTSNSDDLTMLWPSTLIAIDDFVDTETQEPIYAKPRLSSGTNRSL